MRRHPALHAGLLLALAATTLGPLATRSASAQTISDRRDQPTAADVPSEGKARDGAAARPTGEVSPPKAMRPSTAVTVGDEGKNSRTNPLDHLPARDRAATGGRGE